jgi:hypothetical protein
VSDTSNPATEPEPTEADTPEAGPPPDDTIGQTRKPRVSDKDARTWMLIGIGILLAFILAANVFDEFSARSDRYIVIIAGILFLPLGVWAGGRVSVKGNWAPWVLEIGGAIAIPFAMMAAVYFLLPPQGTGPSEGGLVAIENLSDDSPFDITFAVDANNQNNLFYKRSGSSPNSGALLLVPRSSATDVLDTVVKVKSADGLQTLCSVPIEILYQDMSDDVADTDGKLEGVVIKENSEFLKIVWNETTLNAIAGSGIATTASAGLQPCATVRSPSGQERQIDGAELKVFPDSGVVISGRRRESRLEPTARTAAWSLFPSAQAAIRSRAAPYDEGMIEKLAGSSGSRRADLIASIAHEFDQYRTYVMKRLTEAALRPRDRDPVAATLLAALSDAVAYETPALEAPVSFEMETRDLRRQDGTALGAAFEIRNPIIALTAHPDAQVRETARGLLSRFPMDFFERSFQPLKGKGCVAPPSFQPPIRSYPDLALGAVQFYYSRLIEIGAVGLKAMDPPDGAKNWFEYQYEDGAMFRGCLPADKTAEGATLDYARFVSYDRITRRQTLQQMTKQQAVVDDPAEKFGFTKIAAQNFVCQARGIAGRYPYPWQVMQALAYGQAGDIETAGRWFTDLSPQGLTALWTRAEDVDDSASGALNTAVDLKELFPAPDSASPPAGNGPARVTEIIARREGWLFVRTDGQTPCAVDMGAARPAPAYGWIRHPR